MRIMSGTILRRRADPRLFLRYIAFALISISIFYCKASAAFQEIKIETGKIGSQLPVAGTIVEAKKWKDASGTHLFVISEITKGRFCEPDYASELHAYRFTEEKSVFVKKWEIHNYSENACSTVRYLIGTLKLIDIDGNGAAETSFFYENSHDCCDPITVKYILFKDGVPLPITGQVPMIWDDASSYKKDMDKAYEKYPASIKDFASKTWDAIIEEHYRPSE